MHFVRNHLLLLSLVILVLLDPLMEEFYIGGIISILLLGLSCGLCLWVLSAKKRLFVSMIAFTSLVIFLDIINLITQSSSGLLIANVLQALLVFTFAILMFYYMLISRSLSFADVSNAISVYFLVGIGFGFIYYCIELIQPGSFSFNTPHQDTSSGDMLYFSFVALTTAGFGDITPIGKFAKTVVILEMITGVMYVAVTIGKLVGLGYKNEK